MYKGIKMFRTISNNQIWQYYNHKKKKQFETKTDIFKARTHIVVPSKN